MSQNLEVSPVSGPRRLIGTLAAFALPASLALGLSWSGVLPIPDFALPWPQDKGPVGDFAYVPLPSLVVAVGDAQPTRHLRFSASLEVRKGSEAQVERELPRVVDVLNTFLNAVPPDVLLAHGAVVRLRGQMLRRVEMVLGPGQVQDLLISEFLMN